MCGLGGGRWRGEGILQSGEEIAEKGKRLSRAWPAGSSENHSQMDSYIPRRGSLNINRPTCGYKYSLWFKARVLFNNFLSFSF